ncbi:MAG: WD40 repeat domain-containing protein, partial [Pirellulales bacterium]
MTGLALHPREPLLATTTSDGEVRLWRTDTKDQVLRAGQAPPAPAANAPPPSLLPLSSSADGLRLAAAAPGTQVTWLTVADGKPVRDELKLTAPARTLAQRPDGSELVAGDALGKVSLAAAGAGAPLADWQAHEGAVTGTSYHPSGGQVATSGADGVVRVWQLPVPAAQALGRHAGKVTALATSPDGARVYTSGGDGHLKSVELASGKELFDVESPGVTSLAVSADQLVLGASDVQGGVSLRGADGVLALRLHAHTGAARALAFPPRPAPWVSVGDDGTLRVWDAPAPPRVLTGHTGPIERLALSPHGQTIATASTDKTVRLWNLGDGAPSWTLAHDMPVRALAWKGDSQQLATVDEARRVRVWNLVDGQQLVVLEGHTAPVVTLAWGPDGTLVSASADGQIKFWNVAEKKETAQLATGVPLVAAAVVAAPPLLVTGHTDGTLKTWQWADRQPVASWPVGGAVEGLALSADGKLALVAANDKSLRQFALAGGAAGPVVTNLPGPPRGLAWSADGQKFAATLPDGSIRVWSAAGELLEQMDLGPSPPRGIAFTPDSKGVVVGSDDQRVRLARLLAMKKVTVAPQPLTSVAFSNDATTVVVGARDKSVSVWNVSSGAAVRSLAGCTDAVTAVAISPDGSKVFATGLDKQLRCWLLADGQLQFTYPQPAAGSAVRVSRDGQRVAVTLADGAVRVLDVATGRVLQTWLAPGAGDGAAAPAGEPLGGAAFGTDNVTLILADRAGGLHRQTLFALTAFPAHPQGVTALAWSPNGQHLVTAGADKQVKVHDLQGKVVATMQGGEFDLVSLALRRDGGQTAALTRDNQLVFWQNANGQLERKIALPWPATHLAYTLDSTRVVVAGAGEYHVYLVATGRWVESGVLPAGPCAVSPVQIVPPGGPVQPPPTHLAWLGSTGQLTVRRLPWERVLTGHMGAATACTFTPDGVHLVTAGADKTVRLWTAATGAAVRAFPGPTEAQSSVATSADGGRVAAAGADKTIRIWNTADGALVSAIVLPAAIRQLATAPGSPSFVALGDDQIVRLVDWKSGREARRVPTGGTATAVAQSASQQVVWVGPELGARALASELPVQWLADAGKVLAATFLPDGQQCATCGEDRVVKIWKRDGTLVKSLPGYPVPPTGMAV